MASNSHIWLRNRRDFWLLRGIAAIISVLLWITVLKGKKVEITKKVTLDYQLPKDMTIANQVPREVSFRVSGPRAFVRDFEEQPMTLPIDLSAARVGDYEHFLAQDDLDVPFGLKVLSISQSTIPIKIDRLALKRVPVRGVFAGQLTDGMRVVGITFKPSTVDLHGSAQKLQTLENVPTEAIALSPNALKQEFDVKLALAELPGVMVDEPSRVVHVTVELEGSVSRKWLKNIEVGLKVRGGGGLRAVQDAAGLGIRLKPATVSFLMEGPDRIVSKLKSTDIEVWAEIPELRKGNVRARLDWRLSPELRVVRRSSDWVDVVIPPLQ